MSTEIIKFTATDDITLNGYINKSNVSTNKVLIEIHGMASNCFKNRNKIIAQAVEKLGIDTICFDTRGSEIVKYIKYPDGKKVLAGTAYEDVYDCFYDILGAVKYAIKLGYTSIYLQGHSLGATKVLYTYSKMQKENNEYLKYIKSLILLSLVDIPDLINTYCKPQTINYVIEKERKGEIYDLLPLDSFINPISVKTFLTYFKYNKDIDFAKYSDPNYDFGVLNKIEVPLFMRWGDTYEYIKIPAKEHVKILNQKIQNVKKDIDYIENTDHSYRGKEDELAKSICDFLS